MKTIVHYGFDVCMNRGWTNIAIFGLKTYRATVSKILRYLGYQCAHQALYGGNGCSAAAISMIETLPLEEARMEVAKRLWECGKAHDHFSTFERTYKCGC